MNTRIAPSPTGLFHIGTARTAYFNWLAARCTGGKFILRIDDTDLNRNDPAFIKVIFDTMEWMGLDYDALYYQSERINKYKEVANILIKNDLAKKLENGAISLNMSLSDIPNSWEDSIAGEIEITNKDKESIKDLILIKGDGMPTYNFCTVVDDMDLNIDWIIRGVDHISNTSKQITLMSAIQDVIAIQNPSKLTHIGLIHKDGKKISKRDGAVSVLDDYRDKGINRDAFMNFIMKLGWAGTEAGFDSIYPLITRDIALKVFIEKGKMRSQAANLDERKLKWYDKKYKHKNYV